MRKGGRSARPPVRCPFKVEQSVAICNLRRRLCKKVMSAQTANKLEWLLGQVLRDQMYEPENKKGS